MIKLNHSQNLAARSRAGCFPALLLLAGLLAANAPAQTFTTLHSFTAENTNSAGVETNSDGAIPIAGLILAGNTLYGSTYWNGTNGSGTVFAVNTDGTGFTLLHTFTATSGSLLTNSDGARPVVGLILSGNSNIVYGTASAGGANGSGTVFAVNADGTGFTILHTFTARSNYNIGYSGTNSDGAYPDGLILSGNGNIVFGTAGEGGANGSGTVFAVNTDGTGFTNVHTFAAFSDPSNRNSPNSGGAGPYGGLILSGNTLYATTEAGGTTGNGTVFAVNTDGTRFTPLHSFTGNDGSSPDAGLILSGNTLYGTAGPASVNGGTNHSGTVFAVNTDGTGFTNLHNFTALLSGGPYGYGTNRDGSSPDAGLILSGNTLYGTAFSGGSSGSGTVFAINTNGTGFTILHSFTLNDNSNTDGADPQTALILSGNTLYGTASSGGSAGDGTVFSLSFPPQLSITPSGANVILTWPTNDAGFSYSGYALQSTTNLASPAVWATNSPAPVVVNGQNAVTNPISGTQQFYRLSQ